MPSANAFYATSHYGGAVRHPVGGGGVLLLLLAQLGCWWCPDTDASRAPAVVVAAPHPRRSWVLVEHSDGGKMLSVLTRSRVAEKVCGHWANHNSMFANALRTHSRLRLTATVALPATRGISSLIAFRTAIPKNVSLSVSRSFATSQLARNDASKITGNFPIFVTNIAWKTTEDELAQAFSKFGQVTSVNFHTKLKSRIAHVNFASESSAVATVESAARDPIRLASRDLHVEFHQADPSNKLYFTGSGRGESEIKTIFKQYNDSIDIELLKSCTSGFIHFNSTKSATDALKALEGTQTPDGKTLALSYAHDKKSKDHRKTRSRVSY